MEILEKQTGIEEPKQMTTRKYSLFNEGDSGGYSAYVPGINHP